MQYNGVPVGGAKVTYRVAREVRYPDWFYDCAAGGARCRNTRRPGDRPRHRDDRAGRQFHDPVHREAGPDRLAEGRAVVPLHRHRRRDRHDRRDAHRHEDRERRLRRAARDRDAPTRGSSSGQGDRVRDHHDHARRRRAGGEGHAQGSHAEAAGEGARGRTSTAATARGSAPARPPTRNRCPTRASRRAGNSATWCSRRDFETERQRQGRTQGRSSPPGIYRAVLETTDKFGKKVTARHQFTVLNPAADTFNVKVPNVVAAPKWSLEAGRRVHACCGAPGTTPAGRSSKSNTAARSLQSFWTEAGQDASAF